MPNPSRSELAITRTTVTLGHLLMAVSDRGVCYLGLAREPEALEADLAARLPRETWTAATDQTLEWIELARSLIEAPSATHTPPLDLRGTAFQRAVWDAMWRIPLGETRSYGQLARTIGRPRASRAVAGACGANPVGILIPCHRVVRSDGGIGGYHWGADIKQALLAREGALRNDTDGLS